MQCSFQDVESTLPGGTPPALVRADQDWPASYYYSESGREKTT
jgi:hypothetical protein